MLKLPEVSIAGDVLQLFKRDGMYYVRYNFGSISELFEIALHGILSDEEARDAVAALNSVFKRRQANK